MLFSADDDYARPSNHLIDLSLKVIKRAGSIELRNVGSRMKKPPYWPEIWPGEHYRLLAAFVSEQRPKKVIEIGTCTGLSTLSMKAYLPADSQLITFDLIKWDDFEDTILTPDDFCDGQLKQVIGDLGDSQIMKNHVDLFKDAELIFVDGPKDRTFETRFLENLGMINFVKAPYLIFDDIKDWNMLAFWRTIRKPKLDLTSFGHWTGTGLVHWIHEGQT